MDLGKLSRSPILSGHLSLAADNRRVLWAECQNGKGSYPELIEQFHYLTISPQDLPALEGRRKSATERNCKIQTPAVWWGRCRRSSGMMTVGGFQPVDLSYPQEPRRLFRGAEPILSGRLEGGSSWWDTSMSLKRSAPRQSDLDQIKMIPFFLKFISSLLPSFFLLFPPSFPPSFHYFLSHLSSFPLIFSSIYILKSLWHIL